MVHACTNSKKVGKVFFFKERMKFGKFSVRQKLPSGISSLSLVRSTMIDDMDDSDSCADAATKLAISAAAASVACSVGLTPACVVALGNMVYWGSMVIRVCKGNVVP